MKNDTYNRLDKEQQKTTEESARGMDSHHLPASETSGGRNTCSRLQFWGFPGVHGNIQPWRRRLWEMQNNLDRE